MSSTRRVYKVYKKKRKRKRLLSFILVPIFVLALVGTGYAAFLYNKAENVLGGAYESIGKSSKRVAAVDPSEDNISVLFIGIDDSQKRNLKGNTRSDALMLATFNTKNKTIKLVSIPRDSYVHIPENDTYTKITHAHAIGGTKATVETVEELMQIPVDYYVKMNFNAFMDVVDALNGIKVDVPYEMLEQDSKDRKDAIHLMPGKQTLDGEEALAFVRTRHKDSDIYRGKRQQQVMQAIAAKAASAGAISKYTEVIDAIGDNMTTNLTFSEMKAFLDYVLSSDGLQLESLDLKGTDDNINGVYYYQLDDMSLEEIRNTLKTHLELTPEETDKFSASAENETTVQE
ncbi:LCP family protein [Peribacillus deserti]|uniref:Transcriptional regulator n=1 Tax=Peribacillus deserti TaxID=673318 RepID=A0A2N5M9M5_9BACI|nr:LCP family protein [Peribacillus deserti]PLT31056.1 transcriptional regulator [Peribacillus deserti]